MDNIGYSRCARCDEEYVFQEGTRCALCLSLVFEPGVDDDTVQEASTPSLDLPVAA